MNIVIIGFGSIGSRHAEIIKKNFKFAKLFIVSRRKINFKGVKTLKDLEEIKKVNPKYIIVATETSRHFSDLAFLEKNFKNVKILVEKPLFHKKKKIQIKNNKVFVGYNLRFHPAIIFMKKFIKKNRAIDIKFITNSYLPSWRKRSYSSNYAAKKNGGGVILDLSHEIDLAIWLFGPLKINYSMFGKYSKLNIKVEDNLKLIGRFKKSHFFMDISYYSKNEIRNIYIDSNKNSLLIDLKNNIIKVNSKIIKKSQRNYNIEQTYLSLHKAIISNKNIKNVCSYKEGIKVLDLTDKIKSQ